MKNRLTALLIALLTLAGMLMAGCASKSSTSDSVAPGAPQEADKGAPGQGSDAAGGDSASLDIPSDNPAIERKMVYNASMDLTCDDPGTAIEQLSGMAEELGGYVASSWSDTYDGDRIARAQITLKLPAGTLDAFKDFAGELGKIRSYDMSAADITEDYYDLDARLSHAKARERQVSAFMEQAKTVEDTLKVYDELSQIQEDIEVMEGRKRLWDQQVAFSTLVVDITATPVYVDESPEFIRSITMSETWQRARRGFVNVAIGTGNFFKFLFIAAVWLLIPAAIVGGIVWLIIFLVRRGNRKRPPKPPAAQAPPAAPPRQQ